MRDSEIGKKYICSDSERSTLRECGPLQRVSAAATECGVVSFCSLGNVIWEDHSNSWRTTHSSVFWQCLGTVLTPLGVSVNLQIEDQGLVEFDLSSWTHLILISLCYALGLCHSFKSCALPPSLLFHALLLSPVRAHKVAFIISLRDNQKIAGLWEGNTVQ